MHSTKSLCFETIENPSIHSYLRHTYTSTLHERVLFFVVDLQIKDADGESPLKTTNDVEVCQPVHMREQDGGQNRNARTQATRPKQQQHDEISPRRKQEATLTSAGSRSTSALHRPPHPSFTPQSGKSKAKIVRWNHFFQGPISARKTSPAGNALAQTTHRTEHLLLTLFSGQNSSLFGRKNGSLLEHYRITTKFCRFSRWIASEKNKL